MSLEFSTGRTVFEGRELNIALTEMGNAVLLLLWEGSRPLLGSLTVTLPGRISSRLLGERDALLGQVIGEQLASFFQKMALVSIHLKTLRGERVGRKILELTRELIRTRGERPTPPPKGG